MTQQEIRQTRHSVLFMCLIAVKSIIAGLVLISGMILILGVGSAEAASLKGVSLVNDDVIRVADLFEGAAEENAGIVLGRAPEAGKEITIGASALSRIASRYNIDWQPASGDQVVVRREAHTVEVSEMQSAVKSALEMRGVDGSFEISLYGLTSTITLPRNIPATAEVTNLKYTAGRDDFTATLATPSASNPVKTINVSGVIDRTVAIPVMKTAIKSGELIGSTDIEWIDISQRTMSRDTIVDADDLIGKTPTRILAMGTPVRVRDITNPQLVARGDDVTIIYNVGGMQLTAKGKAMQNGAEGDMVRAVNVTSNRSMMAMVTGDRAVTIQ